MSQVPLSSSFDTPIDTRPMMDWNTMAWIDLWFEFIAISSILFYIACYYIGNSKNLRIARYWAQANISVWKENFAHVGNEDHKLVKDGPRDYIYYGSGRIYVQTCYALLRLVARHDPIQYIFDYFAGKDLYDRVTIDVLITETVCDSIVFALLPRKTATNVLKTRWDLDNFPKPRDMTGFPKEHYTMLTDCPEFTNVLWASPKVKKAFWKSLGLDEQGQGELNTHPIIEQISFTDLPYEKPKKLEDLAQPKMLQFVFRLPDFDKADASTTAYQRELSELVMEVIDIIGKHGKLSHEAKSKSIRLREIAAREIMRAEEEERKAVLADQKIKEKKEKMNEILKLSPESQRKAEAKLKKKEAKKLQSKRTKRA
ncbi:hypothetical protein BC833DRAFT_624524 [Globomyces pollinis-pini]|nr:hypothetical protein BC833DRAFT_624524 [Globomyces pollinis-pini]